jgi:hypothetical protein
MDVPSETAWQELGNRVLTLADRKTVSPTLSATRPVPGLPTSQDESRALREWANSLPVEAPDRATPEQITKHLAFLASTLPSKNIDDLAGKMRFAVYVSMLSGFSDKALAHMSRRACETLDWFPTPHQCLEMAKEHNPGQSARQTAITACNHFDQNAFEIWIDGIGPGQPDLNVPEHWIEIALTRAVLRKLDDGTVVTRERFRALRNVQDQAA